MSRKKREATEVPEVLVATEMVPEGQAEGESSDAKPKTAPKKKPRSQVSPILKAAELIRLAGGLDEAKALLDEAQAVADMLLEDATVDE